MAITKEELFEHIDAYFSDNEGVSDEGDVKLLSDFDEIHTAVTEIRTDLSNRIQELDDEDGDVDESGLEREVDEDEDDVIDDDVSAAPVELEETDVDYEDDVIDDDDKEFDIK